MLHVNHMNSEKCSGCTACKWVCPQKAITMITDEEGFYIPKVSEIDCIDCGNCLSVCPVTSDGFGKNNVQFRKAFAFQNLDNKTREKSASGAFFPAIARYIIEKKNGYVCGCILNDNLIPQHFITNQLSDIERMQDSKYVQSDMGECIGEIIELLKDDKWVLFTGTSCQVSGLKTALKKLKVNDSKLVCVDFFCHGVPSPLVWKEYLNFYEREKHKKVIGYRFRSKKYGWGKKARGSSYCNTVSYIKDKEDSISLAARLWRSVFFSDLCIRSYCHSCPYTSIDKPSDIIMGDCWGIDKMHPEFDDGKGCSLVILNSELVKDVLEMLDEVEYIPISTVDIIENQANAFLPSSKGKKRDEFWRDFNSNDFKYVAEKYFRYTRKQRFKDFIKRILFELKLKDLYG